MDWVGPWRDWMLDGKNERYGKYGTDVAENWFSYSFSEKDSGGV
jgi:hypothetical protein